MRRRRPGEALEVAVVGVEFGSVFDGDGRQVGVGSQTATHAGGSEEVPGDRAVLVMSVAGCAAAVRATTRRTTTAVVMPMISSVAQEPGRLA